jgi:hypothetical protein
VAEPRSDDLLRSREEAALLLRLDPQNLSPSDRLRCDLIVTLRLSIDSAQADALEGRAADLGRLIVATESLVKLLPSEPPKPASSRPDPRERMWQVYSEMRSRGELYFEKVERAQLLGQIEALRAEVELLRAGAPAQPSPPMPPAGNVLSLSRASPKDAPAASAAPSPPTAEERQQALARANAPVPESVRDSRPKNEPWSQFTHGAAGADRWRNNNW